MDRVKQFLRRLGSVKYPFMIAAAPVVSIRNVPVPGVLPGNQSSSPGAGMPLNKLGRRFASTPKLALITGVMI